MTSWKVGIVLGLWDHHLVCFWVWGFSVLSAGVLPKERAHLPRKGFGDT